MIFLIGQLLHLLAFYIEYSLAQSERYHQMMSLLRYPVYNISLGLPLNMLSMVDSLLILNENIFSKVVYRYNFHCLFPVFYSYKDHHQCTCISLADIVQSTVLAHSFLFMQISSSLSRSFPMSPTICMSLWHLRSLKIVLSQVVFGFPEGFLVGVA